MLHFLRELFFLRRRIRLRHGYYAEILDLESDASAWWLRHRGELVDRNVDLPGQVETRVRQRAEFHYHAVPRFDRVRTALQFLVVIVGYMVVFWILLQR